MPCIHLHTQHTHHTAYIPQHAIQYNIKHLHHNTARYTSAPTPHHTIPYTILICHVMSYHTIVKPYHNTTQSRTIPWRHTIPYIPQHKAPSHRAISKHPNVTHYHTKPQHSTAPQYTKPQLNSSQHITTQRHTTTLQHRTPHHIMPHAQNNATHHTTPQHTTPHHSTTQHSTSAHRSTQHAVRSTAFRVTPDPTDNHASLRAHIEKVRELVSGPSSVKAYGGRIQAIRPPIGSEVETATSLFSRLPTGFY